MLLETVVSRSMVVTTIRLAHHLGLTERTFPGVFLAVCLFGQLAALAGWIVGLETATYRMQAVPGVLAGLFLATTAGLWWHRTRSRGGRLAVTVVAVAASAAFIEQQRKVSFKRRSTDRA